MRKLYFNIRLHDKNLKRFIKSNGEKVLDFQRRIDYNSVNDEQIEKECKEIADMYKAICKDGADITIEVLEESVGIGTFPCYFSFYANYNKFIKH